MSEFKEKASDLRFDETIGSSSQFSLRPKSCGPGRKQLPSIPDVEPLSSSSIVVRKMERPGSQNKMTTRGDLGGYGPFFLEYSLMAEYQMVQKQKLPGIYVIPSSKSPLQWNGVLFIHQGLYEGGIFRFTLNIPDTFPDEDSPKVIFKPSIYHPQIHPMTGQLDITKSFPTWKRNFHHLWHLLIFIRRIFIKVETNPTLNSEASVLYDEDIESFKMNVLQSIENSKENLYLDPDPNDDHAIRFSKWDEIKHEEVKKQMLMTNNLNPREEGNKSIESRGLSWMKPGSMELFVKKNHESN